MFLRRNLNDWQEFSSWMDRHVYHVVHIIIVDVFDGALIVVSSGSFVNRSSVARGLRK